MTRILCSRIVDDQPQVYAALNWDSILHGNAAILGDYKELAILPDRVARYLADSCSSLGLPPLPEDSIESCTAMRRYLVIIRSLQSFPTGLLDILLTPVLHSDSLRSQKTVAILMYIESSRLRRFYPFVDIRYLYCIFYLAYLCYLLCLFYIQNRALLDTLRKLRSTRGSGHIVLFNTLAIGHTKHPKDQSISSWPFAAKQSRLCLHTPARNFAWGL
jgi:hypothetical protein